MGIVGLMGYTLSEKETKAAEIHLKNLLQKEDRAEARFLLGTTLLAQGDPVSARIELEKVRELGYPADQLVPPLARVIFTYGEYEKVLAEVFKVAPPVEHN